MKGENIGKFQISIYDRWNNLIYSSNSIAEPWDGNYKTGQSVKSGLYVYKCIYQKDNSREIVEKNGLFHLLR